MIGPPRNNNNNDRKNTRQLQHGFARRSLWTIRNEFNINIINAWIALELIYNNKTVTNQMQVKL
jgi:hypothetical protein